MPAADTPIPQGTRTSYTIFVRFKDGATLKSKRTWANIHDKRAYAEAVVQNVQDTDVLMMRSDQVTEGYISIPLSNILWWSFDYWTPDADELSSRSALVDDDEEIEEI